MEAKIAFLAHVLLGEKCLLFCVKYSVCWPVKSFDIGEQQQNQQQVSQFQNTLQLWCAQYVISGAILWLLKKIMTCVVQQNITHEQTELWMCLIMMCLYSWAKSSCYLLFI